MTRPLAAVTAACAALGLFPALAGAAVMTIDGDPLNVSVDEYGSLQARFDGAEQGEFYPPTGEVANAGFHLAVYGPDGSTLYGPVGNQVTPVDADQDGAPDYPIVLPSAPGDPTQRLLLRYTVADGALVVDQIVEYRNGEREFAVQHNLSNNSGQAVAFSAAEFADLFLGGNDAGTGFLLGGPPRVVGGVNPSVPGADRLPGGGLVEFAPRWSGYEVNSLAAVREHLSALGGPAFDGTIVQEPVDNAVGVQWDDHKAAGLAPGGGAQYRIAWRFTEFEVPPPPPVAGETVNVDPTGTVRIKYPPGFEDSSQPAARAAQAGEFVTVTRPVQIPVGSVVDVRRGAVDMTSAANLEGATQTGRFSKGMFAVRQRAVAKPVTDLKLTGGSFRRCRGRASGAYAARRAIRRLRGSARGRFRTRGRYGSATVRGTVWTTSESCAGTRVSVRSGKVRVRDFARNRHVTLRRGDSYLARPKRG